MSAFIHCCLPFAALRIPYLFFQPWSEFIAKITVTIYHVILIISLTYRERDGEEGGNIGGRKGGRDRDRSIRSSAKPSLLMAVDDNEDIEDLSLASRARRASRVSPEARIAPKCETMLL